MPRLVACDLASDNSHEWLGLGGSLAVNCPRRRPNPFAYVGTSRARSCLVSRVVSAGALSTLSHKDESVSDSKSWNSLGHRVYQRPSGEINLWSSEFRWACRNCQLTLPYETTNIHIITSRILLDKLKRSHYSLIQRLRALILLKLPSLGH